MRKIWIGFLLLTGTLFFVSSLKLYKIKADTYEDFADENLIRFHIRAESNLKEDQEVKMKVRTEVLQYIKENLSDCDTKQELRTEILKNRSNIEEVIENTLKQEDKMARISIYFTKEFFPMRKYGQTILPAGIYEALRIDLGKAKGRNWWCVLYPSLCLIDSDHVLEDPDDKKYLDQIFEQDSVSIQYKSYIKEWWKDHIK
jgi:stage II sporulation protein R